VPPGDASPRVLINALAAGSQWTGIGQYVTWLVGALGGCAHPADLFVLTPREGQVPVPAGFHRLFAHPSTPLWEQLSLPALLEDHHIDVYHNPAFGLPVVKPCALVCTVHDCIPRLFPDLVTPRLRDFFARWAETWVQLADHLICVSEHTKHDFVHLYGADPERCTVIYQDVPPCFRPLEDRSPVEAVKAKFGLNKPYILFVGRVELRKNVPRLIEAFRRLQQEEGERWLLVLAGPKDPDAQDPHRELPNVGRHGDAVVTGFVSDEDLVALYNGAEVLCFPSLYEGFGRPVLEAMRCGTPVITSRVSSLPEVGGDAPQYVNPYVAGEIAVALAEVLTVEELSGHMGIQGTKQASMFSAPTATQQYVAAYKAAAGTG
jgi:glycosyltransferase involved in cell wall biosynthesis